MLTGIWLIVALVVAIALMIFMISKLNIHPFLSMLTVSILLALFVLPIQDVAGTINAGFGGTMQSIGIIIILGALIGFIVEKTGAAIKIADVVLKIVGKRNPELAMLIMGWIVSIPVFCDSGFVVLNPIRKSLRARTKKSSVAMTICLSLGLYTSHVFIPPTPGPIAAAASVGLADNILLVIGVGVLVSIFSLIPSYLFAIYIGKKVKTIEDEAEFTDGDENILDKTRDAFDSLKNEYGKIPNGWLSFAPIVVPILCMGMGTVANLAGWASAPFWNFIGAPIIALFIGLIFGVILLCVTGKLKDFNPITNENLKIVGPILFITAAGGVLGRVISVAGVVDFVKENAKVLTTLGILFPFVIAAILKIAQGSSTVAITTTAAMMGLYFEEASVMSVLGFTTPLAAALVVMAIGAGAMTVSHANDSYFWVVTNIGRMTPAQGYKTQTLGTLVAGIGSIIGILILSLILL
jgi:GntP family gluconate:H+ symporter